MEGLGAKVAKAARASENMHAAWGDACCVPVSRHVWTCPDMSGHTVDTGALVRMQKYASGDLSGSGWRKYVLRQNHTIPVRRRDA